MESLTEISNESDVNSSSHLRVDRALRGKSSNRLKYEAEVSLIRRKIGDLESIRQQLGLTQRKICQLLLVDPSAWTRWTKEGEDAPPHIYRMLQWYLALEEKYPALDPQFWLSTVARVHEPQEQRIDQAKLLEIQSFLAKLEKDLKQASLRNEKRSRQLIWIVILSASAMSMMAAMLVNWLF